jgi:glycerophosphoryl diester phosphodiesterase
MTLDWLTARPIAHRGLHNAGAGIVENTASAFAAAIERGYTIETDVQVSADGEAMVHHDDALGRLTEGSAALASLPAAEIRKARFKTTSDRILTLTELCDLVGGRVPLVIELKSHFDRDVRLVRRLAEVLAAYQGPAVAMSFDPFAIEAMRTFAPNVPRGIVAERHYDHHEWDRLSAFQKRRLAFLAHAPWSRPQFIAYAARDLPALAPLAARRLFGAPLVTWTVRSEAERTRVMRYADQVIFEGWLPEFNEPRRAPPTLPG